MQGIWWVTRLERARNGESNVKRDVSGGDHEDCRENVKGLTRAR